MFIFTKNVSIRLPGKGDSNTGGARPVHRIIKVVEWIWISAEGPLNRLGILVPNAPADAGKAKVTKHAEGQRRAVAARDLADEEEWAALAAPGAGGAVVRVVTSLWSSYTGWGR